MYGPYRTDGFVSCHGILGDAQTCAQLDPPGFSDSHLEIDQIPDFRREQIADWHRLDSQISIRVMATDRSCVLFGLTDLVQELVDLYEAGCEGSFVPSNIRGEAGRKSMLLVAAHLKSLAQKIENTMSLRVSRASAREVLRRASKK